MLPKIMVFKEKPQTNILVQLQVKWLLQFWDGSRAELRYNFNAAQPHTAEINYIDYSETCWWSIWSIFKPGLFFGLGLASFYSLDLTWKKKFIGGNSYWFKSDVKWDIWFFYGILVRRHLNLLNGSITIRNVFYNELMEKTFSIFNIWNTLLGEVPGRWLTHLLWPYLINLSWKKNLLFLWQYSRAQQRITFKS